MRKLVVIIIVLGIILGGMVAYQYVVKQENIISIQEIEKIENYLNQIYTWQEITEEALPEFQEINQANEKWIWEVVKKNLEDYELSYEQIQEKAKELFGEKFTKELAKEGTKYFVYDEENNRYYAEEIELDQKEDSYILNKIDKIENGYEVEIVEYLEDYSQTTIEGESYIIVRNTKGEEIGKIGTKNEEEAKEIVKNNIDKLSKKKITLKEENGKLYIEKVQK
ncbi:hypothetical protein [uncultured Clostridium sp.]|uniref:hypothetical protein n=1 Tax=uncultured Clostridium sp. TaxID=59620 RepID=UPI00262C73EB|nr:hypothetical protein [uncultured Clostridium sp.]MCI8471056.1 hypothetical protein [Clostridia bacterium]